MPDDTEEIRQELKRLRDRLRACEEESEARARRQADQLLQTEKLVSLQALAGGVAHDFNNLLAGVLGNSGLAKEGLEKLEVDKGSMAFRAVEQIEVATERTQGLVRKLLIYTGRTAWKGQQINPAIEVGRILADVDPAGEIQQDLDLQAPQVVGDPGHFGEMLRCLLDNAREAGGEVMVRLRYDSPPEPSQGVPTFLAENLPALPPGIRRSPQVLLEVCDTGAGMDDEAQSRLCDPFYSTKEGHRGLGMPVVLGIVRIHQGFIQVESEPGQGTTLRVGLPKSQTKKSL